MTSSKMMPSTSAANLDLPRYSHPFSASGAGGSGDRSRFGSMNVDELLKNMYADGEAFPAASAADNGGGGGRGMSLPRQGSLTMPRTGEVWNDLVTGQEQGMTLEDFLAKAGAATEEDVGIPVMPTPGVAFSGDPMANSVQFQVPPHMQSTQGFGVDSMGFGNGIDGRMIPLPAAAGGSGGGGGRGKRRAVEEPPMDRATQQKQRRMIKNRESAARSRERKQAYTIELESLVTQLEEENARLLREEAKLMKERYELLMQNLIPVVEQRRRPRPLRRANSI